MDRPWGRLHWVLTPEHAEQAVSTPRLPSAQMKCAREVMQQRAALEWLAKHAVIAQLAGRLAGDLPKKEEGC